MTHDYKRHGTTTLFAALNVIDGTVTGRNMQRHPHQEFIRFLNAVDRDIHVILDNYAPHKHAKVRAWLERHPRWTFHFTPTSSSWLNAVEGFFAKLTRRRLKHGVFHSIVDLQAAINRFLAEHNRSPKPFIWRADPDAIIAARNRGSKRWSQSTSLGAQLRADKWAGDDRGQARAVGQSDGFIERGTDQLGYDEAGDYLQRAWDFERGARWIIERFEDDRVRYAPPLHPIAHGFETATQSRVDLAGVDEG